MDDAQISQIDDELIRQLQEYVASQKKTAQNMKEASAKRMREIEEELTFSARQISSILVSIRNAFWIDIVGPEQIINF